MCADRNGQPRPLFARPIGHDYIERAFGPDSIRPVTGPAGTAFMIDVNGIDAGPIPAQRPRLMLTVGYPSFLCLRCSISRG